MIFRFVRDAWLARAAAESVYCLDDKDRKFASAENEMPEALSLPQEHLDATKFAKRIRLPWIKRLLTR